MASETSPNSQRRRVAIATFIGSTVEWYDFFVYGTASALVLNQIFFPEYDDVTGTLLAFVTFAVGWLARPIGGVIAGHYGDRIGRKSMLVFTMLTMGIATFAVGILPTYEQIGVFGSVLLLTARIIQGLAVGGEYGGSVVMALENAPKNKRGLWASLPQAGVPFGLVLGTVVFALVTLLPESAFVSWGWRVPFLVSAVLVALGLFVRLRVVESDVFEKVQQEDDVKKVPAIEAIKNYPGRIVLLMLAHIAPNSFFYLSATFIIAFATGSGLYDQGTVLLCVSIAAFVEVFTIPWFASLSDRYGRKPFYIGGLVALAVLTYPFFLLVQTGSVLALGLALVVVLSFAHGAVYGTQASFFSELFPTKVRYSGLSIGYQVAGAIFGGPLPAIGTALVAFGGGKPWIFAAYLVATAIVSIVGAAFLPQNRTADVDALAKDRAVATVK